MGWKQHRIYTICFYSADVARAREELDGLRRPTRPFNPLTIIQVQQYIVCSLAKSFDKIVVSSPIWEHIGEPMGFQMGSNFFRLFFCGRNALLVAWKEICFHLPFNLSPF